MFGPCAASRDCQRQGGLQCSWPQCPEPSINPRCTTSAMIDWRKAMTAELGRSGCCVGFGPCALNRGLSRLVISRPHDHAPKRSVQTRFCYCSQACRATLVRQVGAPHELRRSDLKDRSHSHCWVNGSKEIDDVSMRAMLVEHVRTPIRNSAATHPRGSATACYGPFFSLQ